MITNRRPGDGARPPLRGIVGWLVAFWISLSIVDAHKDWLAYRLAGQPITLVTSLVDQAPWWGVWVLLAPGVALLAWRFPPVGSRWKVRLPVHVVAGILVAGAQVLLSSLLFELRSGEIRWEPLYDRMVDFFGRFVLFNLVAYFGMVGAVAAWTYYRGMREREEEAVQLAVRASELERGMSEARLESLRRQLHPHFLFNSLNTVASLARMGETARVTSMLERLGNLLRLRLDDQPDEITLERELAWMDDYLAIERERFDDRLDIQTSVPRELRRALVPAMLLQPLVENAVRHGIASEDGCGWVEVQAYREESDIVLAVSDSGPVRRDRNRRRHGRRDCGLSDLGGDIINVARPGSRRIGRWLQLRWRVEQRLS